MSDGAAATRPHGGSGRARRAMVWTGLAVAAAACVPDLVGVASGSEGAQALWFALAAMVAPALIALGSPRSWQGADRPGTRRLSERLALAPTTRRGLLPSVAVLSIDILAIVSWRTPLLVDALARHPALVIAQSATLVAAGIGIWVELVDGTLARSSRPRRGSLAALVMWTVWTLAYLEGMSTTGWYHAFHHVAGTGLSAAADRQLSALALWAIAAVVFMPVVFWNLAQWLRAEGTAAPASLEGAAG